MRPAAVGAAVALRLAPNGPAPISREASIEFAGPEQVESPARTLSAAQSRAKPEESCQPSAFSCQLLVARSRFKTAWGLSPFAESAEQKGTVPLSENGFETAFNLLVGALCFQLSNP